MNDDDPVRRRRPARSMQRREAGRGTARRAAAKTGAGDVPDVARRASGAAATASSRGRSARAPTTRASVPPAVGRRRPSPRRRRISGYQRQAGCRSAPNARCSSQTATTIAAATTTTERRASRTQRGDDDQRGEADADADRGRQVAAGPAASLGRRHRSHRDGSSGGCVVLVVVMVLRAGSSDLEQLGFLVLEQLVDRVDVLLGDRRRARFSAPVTSSSPTSPSFAELLEASLGVAAHVADRDPAVLGLVPWRP